MDNNSVNSFKKTQKERAKNMLLHYPDILTPRDVMEILSISKNTLYHMIQNNDLPAFRLGPRSWRFRRDDLIAYLEEATDYRY